MYKLKPYIKMNREIKFRGLRITGSGFIYGYLNYDRVSKKSYISQDHVYKNSIGVMASNCYEVVSDSAGQYTGLKDKNGKEIYEGDIVYFCKPIRTTQTHEGDNIPNGSYTEPMEPSIQHFEGEIKFENGCFVFEDYETNTQNYPLDWNIKQWDEESIKEAISYNNPGRFIWDDPEDGDMQYLLEENNFNTINDLIDFLSGVTVIGNIHEQ